jgi:hypothetical protein
MPDEDKKSSFQSELDEVRARRVAQVRAEEKKREDIQTAQDRFNKEGRPEALTQFKKLKTDILAELEGQQDLVKPDSNLIFDGRTFQVAVDNKYLVVISFQSDEAEIAVSFYEIKTISVKAAVPRLLDLGESSKGQIFWRLLWEEKSSKWLWHRISKKFATRSPSLSNDLLKYFSGQEGKYLSYDDLLRNVLYIITSLLSR